MRSVFACLGLAAASLLLLRVPSYDPSAWLIWGRELTDGTLSMTGGPSWKPLPVGFTTPFALAGSGAAPLLWLLVARTSGFVGAGESLATWWLDHPEATRAEMAARIMEVGWIGVGGVLDGNRWP